MKTKFFLWAGIFSLLLTACGNDDNGDDPTTSLNDSKLVFTKMANCPVSAELHSTVYNGLIYFNSGAGDFISYNPEGTNGKHSQGLRLPIISTYSFGRGNYIGTAAVQTTMFVSIGRRATVGPRQTSLRHTTDMVWYTISGIKSFYYSGLITFVKHTNSTHRTGRIWTTGQSHTALFARSITWHMAFSITPFINSIPKLTLRPPK